MATLPGWNREQVDGQLIARDEPVRVEAVGQAQPHGIYERRRPRWQNFYRVINYILGTMIRTPYFVPSGPQMSMPQIGTHHPASLVYQEFKCDSCEYRSIRISDVELHKR